LIVRSVLAAGQLKHAAKNDRDIAFLEQFGVFDRLITAVDDQPQLILLGEVDRSLDLAGAVG
jgi:hypothetical protein